MVNLEMLDNPEVKAWLGGIEPAWTLLDRDSFVALHQPPMTPGSAVQLARDLTPGEMAQSAVASNLAIFLRAATAAPGLKLTAAGNLSRSVVAEMIELFNWPNFDKAQLFRLNKVVNEYDFWPLFFIRQLAEAMRFLRKSKGHVRTSPVGRASLDEANLSALQALLFPVTMWHIDLSDFGRGLHGRWPQGDVGVVLWSLSVAASDWQSPERLTRMCTIPTRSVLAAEWDSSSMMMEARILRTLQWFGLLDHKREAVDGQRFGERHFYRKTELFNRFLSFNVKTEASPAIRH